MNRKDRYSEKMAELLKNCLNCRDRNNPERCDYSCQTGFKIRMLEAEYSDVTGWSHDLWRKE